MSYPLVTTTDPVFPTQTDTTGEIYRGIVLRVDLVEGKKYWINFKGKNAAGVEKAFAAYWPNWTSKIATKSLIHGKQVLIILKGPPTSDADVKSIGLLSDVV